MLNSPLQFEAEHCTAHLAATKPLTLAEVDTIVGSQLSS
jgi:hypothetical protein